MPKRSPYRHHRTTGPLFHRRFFIDREAYLIGDAARCGLCRFAAAKLPGGTAQHHLGRILRMA